MSPTPRLILPDLARGLALLGIAAANATQAWMINDAPEPGGTIGGVRPDSALDQFFAVFSAMFVHVRGLPMFSTLLGFGVGLIAASLYRKAYPLGAARRVIARRYAFLALFGLVHLFLLFYGDIMSTYGLIGVLLALLFSLPSTWLRVLAYSSLGLFTLLTTFGAVVSYALGGGLDAMSTTPTAELTGPGAYLSANFASAMGMLLNVPFAALQLGALSIIGYVWAREGYLVDVDAHRRTLLAWVGVAAAVIVFLGLPWGLASIGVLDPALEEPLMIANTSWGLFTGPGILALFALLTRGITTNPAWAYPLVALGKRSMSGYLAQSFLFILLAMPFGFGLGLEASVSGKLGVGLLVWLITLGLATVLEATDTPGPFEWVHRRLAYGRTGALPPYGERRG